jgi:hypothetical protein
MALDGLVEVGDVDDVADPLDAWSCAASSALIVLGDSDPLCEELPELAVDVDVELLPEMILAGSKPVVEVCVTPVDGGVAEELFEVSCCSKLRADDAAASSMTILLDLPRPAAPIPWVLLSKPCAKEKNPDKTTALSPSWGQVPRQMMPRRQNLPPSPRLICLHCPCAWLMLRGSPHFRTPSIQLERRCLSPLRPARW